MPASTSDLRIDVRSALRRSPTPIPCPAIALAGDHRTEPLKAAPAVTNVRRVKGFVWPRSSGGSVSLGTGAILRPQCRRSALTLDKFLAVLVSTSYTRRPGAGPVPPITLARCASTRRLYQVDR